MTRSAIETILGAVVILIAAYFLVFSYRAGNSGGGSGYEIYADFAGIGGLKSGDDVSISGVKVGSVSSVELVPDSYLARVKVNVQEGLKLPSDTAALISSQSLLGGRYLSLEPGAEEDVIPAGGKIQYTQAPQNLEQLLGQFIFSMKDEKDKKEGAGESSPPPGLEMPQAETPPEPIAPESVSEPSAGQP